MVWLGLLVAGFDPSLLQRVYFNLFYIQILEQIGINIILAAGLNLIVGFSGQSHRLAGFMIALTLQPFFVLNHQPMGFLWRWF